MNSYQPPLDQAKIARILGSDRVEPVTIPISIATPQATLDEVERIKKETNIDSRYITANVIRGLFPSKHKHGKSGRAVGKFGVLVWDWDGHSEATFFLWLNGNPIPWQESTFLEIAFLAAALRIPFVTEVSKPKKKK